LKQIQAIFGSWTLSQFTGIACFCYDSVATAASFAATHRWTHPGCAIATPKSPAI
jgi:hypothetical protein